MEIMVKKITRVWGDSYTTSASGRIDVNVGTLEIYVHIHVNFYILSRKMIF